MKLTAIATAFLLLAQPALAFDQDCGENISPLNSIAGVNNGMMRLAQTPTPPSAGTYLVCGSFSAKALSGTTITTRHGDVGTNPDSIDTAPAGGSTNGMHV